MAKLAVLLALAHATLLYGLPAGDREGRALKDRQITLSTDLEVTTSYSSIPETFQSVTATVEPSITGSVVTGLPTGITREPLGPTIVEPTVTLAPIDSSLDPGPTQSMGRADGNIFVPMATDAPPQHITRRDDHVVKKTGIKDQDVPIGTNKFYANFFLGNQDQPVWTQPYSLRWAKGRGDTWGIAVSHVEREQFAWGEGDVPRYFIGPVGIQHIVFSAEEFGQQTSLSTESLTAFSAVVNLAPSADAEPLMSIPCVQGMGFVTAVYRSAQPKLNSGTFFRTLEYVGRINGITYKYKIVLEDNSEWLLYATPVASAGAPPFDLVNSNTIRGPPDYMGMIQVAKNPAQGEGEAIYDSTSGAFAVNATLSGSVSPGVSGSAGSYTLTYGKDGVQNQTLLMFALPHLVESFDDETKNAVTPISLVTVTKGMAQAVKADKLTMYEPNLPSTISFGPWVPSSDPATGGTENTNLAGNALTAINQAGARELGEDFDKQTRLDSMYYSGKALAKFANILYVVQDIGRNSELAAAGLIKLKKAFDVFVTNTQPLPLVYDTVWKGVVSSGTYLNGNTGIDFGNALYNDHHFHYGYFVYTAAVIGYLDPAWLDEGTNRAYINTLVRDFANPSTNDPYFPFQRSFDWYNGHSWAKGLFESGDGKDQESTSEDTFSSYALKMWGKVTRDANMEARGNLMLAVQARSLRNYFLLESDNKVQPERFIPNKVTGILFENKIDHTTYFGANPEYIQGIHMLPLNPASAYTRSKKFVQEEWDAYFSNGRADQVQGGWRGVLYGNLAIVDPESAFRFFSSPSFDTGLLDSGASLTWYLAYSAALSPGAVAGANVESVGNDEAEPVTTHDVDEEGVAEEETDDQVDEQVGDGEDAEWHQEGEEEQTWDQEPESGPTEEDFVSDNEGVNEGFEEDTQLAEETDEAESEEQVPEEQVFDDEAFPEDIPEETFEETPEEVVEDTFVEASQESPMETPEDSSMETFEEAPEDAAFEGDAEEAFEETSEEAPEELSEGAFDDASFVAEEEDAPSVDEPSTPVGRHRRHRHHRGGRRHRGGERQ